MTRRLLLAVLSIQITGCMTPQGRWSIGGETWGKQAEEEPREGEFARKGPGVLVWMQYRY